jgi:hypothetical protein
MRLDAVSVLMEDWPDRQVAREVFYLKEPALLRFLPV